MMHLLVTLIVAGTTLVGIAIFGGLLFLAAKFVSPSGRRAMDDRQEDESAQELYRQLEQLEARVESLETIIISGRRDERGNRP